MLRLRVFELLEESGRTKYWLYKQLGMSYQNFNRMLKNETQAIRFSNIEALCQIFNVTPDELFEWDFEKKEGSADSGE